MGDLSKVIDTLRECWQIKFLASFFITGFTFLVGDIDAAFIALWILVVLDTATRWAAISRHTVENNKLDCGLFGGFMAAWRCKALNSHEMRVGFVSKVFAYITLLIASNLLTKILPSVTAFGVDWSRAPDDFVNAFLAITEMISMVENLRDMGVKGFDPLLAFFCRKRDSMTGTQPTQPIQPTQPPKEAPKP